MRLLLASCSGGLVGLRRLGGLPRVAGSSSLGMARVLSIENVDQKTLEEVLQETSAALRGGGVVAIPTDTIYGMASLVSSNEGIERIYEMKGRLRDKPLAICVSEVEQVCRWAKVTVPSSLLSRLLPGPVTTVFERGGDLNPALNPGLLLVGLRIPDSSFVRCLVEQCGCPLALTSANLSHSSSTLSVQEFRELWSFLDVVVDGGVISHGGRGGEEEASRLGSTVVDLSHTGSFSIIRPGIHYQQTVKLLRDEYHLKEIVI
ncbi:YrdC domain-containing protein, mitochondrial [Geodia barretti]|uniref:Threonylcarbamoyl-AMP synthase n=1 Tax=Geodia barretti TaxID=519541 RepID=A0AA35WLS6_GEOBA|nr:YrdC domain-containing protein, mitochondrial [Geodia barretti]